MGFKIYEPTEQIKKECLTIVIYGEPSSGKTSLAFQCNDPLLFDFDDGAHRAVKRGPVITIDQWEDIAAIQDKNIIEKRGCKTLIIDTGGTMLDNFVSDYVKRLDPKANRQRGGDLTLKGYGAMKNVFKQFRDWAKSQKLNLVFVCHDKEDRDGDDVQKKPLMTGGSYDLLKQSADLIGYLFNENGKKKITFDPTTKHVGKDCAEIGELVIPHYADAEYEGFLQGIIDTTLDRVNRVTDEARKAIQELEDYEKDISKLKTIKEANAQRSIIMEMDDKMMQRQYAIRLRDQCAKHDLVFDKDKNSYVKQKELVDAAENV